MYGRARIVCAMYTALIVNAKCHEPSAPCGIVSSRTNTPTITGGSARLALARRCSARRPRKRPSPIVSPIGSPMMSAAAVETAAMRMVTHVTARMYPLPPTMSGMALRISCQRNPISVFLRGRSRSGRRPVGRWRGDRRRRPGCHARSSAAPGLGSGATFWPGWIRIALGVLGCRPWRVIDELRCSEDSAASRNATESTIPRSNRLTRPSSGSPARSSRLRARGVTEIMARLRWAVVSLTIAATYSRSDRSWPYMRSRDSESPNATAPMSRPTTVTLKATRRFSLRAAVLPLARPVSAGDNGISVPIRPSAGPARTSRRVRPSRRWESKSKSANALLS